jgi:hypothetical protein
MRFGHFAKEYKQKFAFIELYKFTLFLKFNPNQPRANDGKWTSGNDSQAPLQMQKYRSRGQSKTPSQMNKDIEKDNKLKSVDRVDKGNPNEKEKPHVHFGPNGKDGALNNDGSWEHPPKGNPVTRYIEGWLEYYGWKTPPK